MYSTKGNPAALLRTQFFSKLLGSANHGVWPAFEQAKAGVQSKIPRLYSAKKNLKLGPGLELNH